MSNQLKSTSGFELLEINLISAQQLKPPIFTSRKDLQTYAVLWIDPKQKLRSRVDTVGFENPTWNETFLFMVDTKTLERWSTAQLIIQFYSVHRFGNDKLIGTSRVLLGSFGNCKRRYSEKTTGTFRGFHVRRPSGKAQGIFHIGITILDGLPHKTVINDQFMGIGSAIDCQKMFGARTEPVTWRGRLLQPCRSFLVFGLSWICQ